ncbi:hypothetical protein GJ496_002183 [Pomphorhynchus laevis]|nr:hypothetical protein GJ496_002183 [Pomphorhynchus laevis]
MIHNDDNDIVSTITVAPITNADTNENPNRSINHYCVASNNSVQSNVHVVPVEQKRIVVSLNQNRHVKFNIQKMSNINNAHESKFSRRICYKLKRSINETDAENIIKKWNFPTVKLNLPENVGSFQMPNVSCPDIDTIPIKPLSREAIEDLLCKVLLTDNCECSNSKNTVVDYQDCNNLRDATVSDNLVKYDSTDQINRQSLDDDEDDAASVFSIGEILREHQSIFNNIEQSNNEGNNKTQNKTSTTEYIPSRTIDSPIDDTSQTSKSSELRFPAGNLFQSPFAFDFIDEFERQQDEILQQQQLNMQNESETECLITPKRLKKDNRPQRFFINERPNMTEYYDVVSPTSAIHTSPYRCNPRLNSSKNKKTDFQVTRLAKLLYRKDRSKTTAIRPIPEASYVVKQIRKNDTSDNALHVLKIKDVMRVCQKYQPVRAASELNQFESRNVATTITAAEQRDNDDDNETNAKSQMPFRYQRLDSSLFKHALESGSYVIARFKDNGKLTLVKTHTENIQTDSNIMMLKCNGDVWERGIYCFGVCDALCQSDCKIHPIKMNCLKQQVNFKSGIIKIEHSEFVPNIVNVPVIMKPETIGNRMHHTTPSIFDSNVAPRIMTLSIPTKYGPNGDIINRSWSLHDFNRRRRHPMIELNVDFSETDISENDISITDCRALEASANISSNRRESGVDRQATRRWMPQLSGEISYSKRNDSVVDTEEVHNRQRRHGSTFQEINDRICDREAAYLISLHERLIRGYTIMPPQSIRIWNMLFPSSQSGR